ncbi:MAG: phenylalanine--tRNA ligase beta subunit-related protein [Candidatus Shapirobacteria bacterium]|jgi:phenylalanyl-tRNA synthetase beta chain
MKLIYSVLQQLLPGLTTDTKKLRDDLTAIGHFVSSVQIIDSETVFDLEIRQNRGDCLGYYGLARDLSVLYHLPIALPQPAIVYPASGPQLPITVTATSHVKRIQAVRLSGLQSQSSPPWLQSFLKHHQVNSVNTLVDLTNYIMFLYSIPNHAFDTAKSGDRLIWELNHQFSQFTTLDGTTLKLRPGVLMVNNPTAALSLSFLGGQSCAIDTTTTEAIIEMAVYDRVKVRTDYRELKTVTEAAIRLDKDLDPQLLPLALNHLVSLIVENCHGKVTSSLFDYYPAPISLPAIPFDPHRPSLFSGISIPADFAYSTLQALGCSLPANSDPESPMSVTPPSLRPDLTIEEDLIEEVIRFFGYSRIPLDQPISSAPLPDITPPVLRLIEKIKDDLVSLGYDEVRSWPLVQEPQDPGTAIYAQNSINSEYPVLRQSLIQSLSAQLDHYQRFKLPQPQFFEIGKVYFRKGDQFFENYSLGAYHHSASRLSSDLSDLGLGTPTTNFFEINLDDLVKSMNPQALAAQPISAAANPANELTSQIITLDANLTLPSREDPIELIKKYQPLIPTAIFWQMAITDIYPDPATGHFRYTFRVSYFNCDDKTAKKIHLSAFGLTPR